MSSFPIELGGDHVHRPTVFHRGGAMKISFLGVQLLREEEDDRRAKGGIALREMKL